MLASVVALNSGNGTEFALSIDDILNACALSLPSDDQNQTGTVDMAQSQQCLQSIAIVTFLTDHMCGRALYQPFHILPVYHRPSNSCTSLKRLARIQ